MTSSLLASRWPSPGRISTTPCPAIAATTWLASGGSSSSRSPWNNNRGRPAQRAGDLAAGRLRREGDDADHRHRHDHRRADGDGAAEAVSHHHHTLGACIAGEFHPAGQIVCTQVEVVRLSVADAHELDTTLRPPLAETLVQPVARPEHAAHRPAARDDRRPSVRGPVRGPMAEHGQQAARGVHLAMRQRRADGHLGRCE